MIVLVPVLVCLLGLLVWALASKPEHTVAREAGKIAYSWGLLVSLLAAGNIAVQFLRVGR